MRLARPIGQYRSQPCLMSLALENFKAVQTAILYYSIYSTYINIKRKAIFVRDIVIELFESENSHMKIAFMIL